MSGAMHTPGPWELVIVEMTDGKPFCHVYGADGDAIVYATLRDPEEVAANALLIAAAPELLQALEAMIDERWSDLHSHMRREQFDRHFASELAAIAKAKGEQA